jgi:transposase
LITHDDVLTTIFKSVGTTPCFSTVSKLSGSPCILQQEVERLKVSRDLDSKTSSKPPSGDIQKKSENKKALLEEEPNHPKRKPGGQPGYQGKTRKGFSRVDCSIINTLLDERF